MKKVFVIVVAMLLLAASVFARVDRDMNNFHPCERQCRERQHEKQEICIEHFNHEYRECKEEF